MKPELVWGIKGKEVRVVVVTTTRHRTYASVFGVGVSGCGYVEHPNEAELSNLLVYKYYTPSQSLRIRRWKECVIKSTLIDKKRMLNAEGGTGYM